MPKPNLKYDSSQPIHKGFSFDDTQMKMKAEKDNDGSLKSLTLEGYITNDERDAAGDVITKEGWKLDRYKSNPVVLYNHGHDIIGGIPIGKGEIKEDDKGIWSKTTFFINQLTRPIVEAVAESFLRGFSVGFMPLDGEYDERSDTYYIKEKELMEYSVVTIPCLASALGSLGVKSIDEYKAKSGDVLNELKKQWKKEAEEKAAQQAKENENEGDEDGLSLEDALKEADEKAIDKDIEKQETPDSMVLQTLIFSKDDFTKEQAEAWLKEHDKKIPEAVEKDKTYHYTQRDSDDFKEGSFRTIKIDAGIAGVVGKLKDDAKGVNDDLRDNPPPPTTVEDTTQPLQKTVEEDLLTAMQTQTAILGLILDQLKTLTDVLATKGDNKLATPDNPEAIEGNNSDGSEGSTLDDIKPDDDETKAWEAFAKATEGLANATKV